MWCATPVSTTGSRCSAASRRRPAARCFRSSSRRSDSGQGDFFEARSSSFAISFSISTLKRRSAGRTLGSSSRSSSLPSSMKSFNRSRRRSPSSRHVGITSTSGGGLGLGFVGSVFMGHTSFGRRQMIRGGRRLGFIGAGLKGALRCHKNALTRALERLYPASSAGSPLQVNPGGVHVAVHESSGSLGPCVPGRHGSRRGAGAGPVRRRREAHLSHGGGSCGPERGRVQHGGAGDRAPGLPVVPEPARSPGGWGATFPGRAAALFVEVRYVHVAAISGVPNTNYVPLTVGARFAH